MTAILYLIPISIGLGAIALLGFFWSVRTRQYSNLESDAYRVLTAEDVPLDDREKEALRAVNKHL